MKLKNLRKSIGLTQPEAASVTGIPFRTYCRYEDEHQYENTFKYNQMIEILTKYASKTILPLETIKSLVSEVLIHYNVSTCYLFGSYAKGKAKPNSDIDLMIVSEIEGIEFYEIVGKLEEKLHKKVDLLRLETAVQNVKLMNDILKEGVKIYG